MVCIFLYLSCVLDSKENNIKLENIFHCKWGKSDYLNATESISKTFKVTLLRPTTKELEDYKSVIQTWTSANTKLGLGIVRGVAKASQWANNTVNSWQLPESHPRNNKTNCVRLATQAGIHPIQIYQEYRAIEPFYVARASNAFIHETGITFISCGYYQPLEGCETIFKFIGKRWWARCSGELAKLKTTWTDMITGNQSAACAEKGDVISKHDAVFVISAAWDYNYHHFLIDGVAKLIRNIDFLLENPSIKIHIRRAEVKNLKLPQLKAAGVAMRKRIFTLLGIKESRLISGPVIARTVYVPRGIKCNYPIAHALEIRYNCTYWRTAVLFFHAYFLFFFFV